MKMTPFENMLRAATAGCLVILPMMSVAADQIEMIDGLPADYAQRVQAIQKGLGSETNAETARGIYWKTAVWPPNYRQLRVCFFGGTLEARKLIARFASAWIQGEDGLKLDFGQQDEPPSCKSDGKGEMQIRIGFDKKGWWSALGQDSVVHFPQDQQSMNLARYGNLTEDTWSDVHVARVRHEFGHALGLMHEHQSPNAPCEDDFDWKTIYQVLGGPPDRWSEWVVDLNMRKLKDENIKAKEFDRLSVMHFSFPVNFFKEGALSECFIERTNLEISQGDHALIAGLYPAAGKARLENFQRTQAAFVTLWNNAGEEASKGISIDAIKAYFERPVLMDKVNSSKEE